MAVFAKIDNALINPEHVCAIYDFTQPEEQYAGIKTKLLIVNGHQIACSQTKEEIVLLLAQASATGEPTQ